MLILNIVGPKFTQGILVFPDLGHSETLLAFIKGFFREEILILCLLLMFVN